MKPDTHTVQQLFERDVRYIVPLYQRPYVWDEEHQWAPLWDDVTALLQHQESNDPSGLWSHFLGAIVLDQQQTVPGQIPRFTVIDGQQRLTTLQLLLAATAQSLANAGANDDAELLRELAMNNPRKAKGTDRLKVWPTNANRDAFTGVMSPGGPPPGHVDDPDNLIDEAFDYFAERTTEYLSGQDREDTEEGPLGSNGGAASPAAASSRLELVGQRAVEIMGRESYRINAGRAQQFLAMIDELPELREALEQRPEAELRAMVSPGSWVNAELIEKFGSAIERYSAERNYGQVNWLRGAIAVFLASNEVAEDATEGSLEDAEATGGMAIGDGTPQTADQSVDAAGTAPGLGDQGNGLDPALAERAERLRITLCDLLKVVSITLESDDNAQVIFETLNARGTPLLALDLVKNAVFYEAARQQRDTDALYAHVWQPQLDDDYWRQERRQGRLNRPIGELFLMHWLTMRLERVIPATELFATFRQSVLASNTDAEALIRELCADAEVMRSFDTPTPKTPEAEFFARLVPLDAGTVLPIVLLLFRSPEVSLERRRRALRMLESWLTRRALMRLTAKNYNRLVPRLVAKMKADLEHADDALFAALSGGEGEISRWPDDGEFVDFLRNRDVYGWVAQPRLVMALAAVEASLYSSKTDVPELAGGLSLEHLLPQEWEKHWPLNDATGKPLEGEALEEASAARWARLHRLGNLTIVTHPLNSALSNSPWTTKRGELNKHSRLLLNARLAERDTWNEKAVDDHGEWLAQRLVKIWPGPNPTAWASRT